eukprot:CAMPEP_0172582924 /NCGR_PEP_ID=MMETSP1068-20121228/2488_1 /TAXON_ID=35684 /ORGANISM="Pseudopedinella elastica, Strain CCMP716" /LENGTH=153 /DNA_ID=CAMNT_0013376511 /DNA_START=28 /DNA_END=489 /DNA_ORIENTATION=+
MRVAFLISCLVGTAAAFAPAAFSPAVESRVMRRATVTMARNPMKTLKLRTKRLNSNERGRMRLNIFRSNNHIYGQVINDTEETTLVAASTKALKISGANVESATAAGKALGEAAKAKGIEALFFDRESANNKYVYHGRIAAFVDAVRETGVKV